MKKNIINVIIIYLMLSATMYAKDNIKADQVVKEFLGAVVILDLKEGKDKLRQHSWGYMNSFPDIVGYTKLFGSTFKTDSKGIEGYKQLLRVKVLSKAGTELVKKYIVICYKEKKTNLWKVFEMRTSVDDLNYEVEAAKKNLGNTRFVKNQYNYNRYGYWLMMTGRIVEARDSFTKAIEIDKKDPGRTKIDFNKSLQIANSILGTK